MIEGLFQHYTLLEGLFHRVRQTSTVAHAAQVVAPAVAPLMIESISLAEQAAFEEADAEHAAAQAAALAAQAAEPVDGDEQRLSAADAKLVVDATTKKFVAALEAEVRAKLESGRASAASKLNAVEGMATRLLKEQGVG